VAFAEKIKTIEKLAEVTALSRFEKKKVVHCHGCFDLLHIGHIRYLRQAREMGDILVVTVTPDRYVDKGPHRPAFTEALRAESLASLDCVDYVAVNQWPTAEETLRLLKPDIYVKGSDFQSVESDKTGKLAGEARVVEEINAELRLTQDIVYSSSSLINRFFSPLPNDAERFLEEIRSRYRPDTIQALFDSMSGLRVLIIGDTVFNEIEYCSLRISSSKTNPILVESESRDCYAGGVIPIANQVAGFTRNVHLISALEENKRLETIVQSSLNPGVSAGFEIQTGRPASIRKYFIDRNSRRNIFSHIPKTVPEFPGDKYSQFCQKVKKDVSGYDLVMAVDFGQGVIGDQLKQILSENALYLAIHVSDNAWEENPNLLAPYSRMNFIAASENEDSLKLINAGEKSVLPSPGMPANENQPTIMVKQHTRGDYLVGKDGEGYRNVPFFSQRKSGIGNDTGFFPVAALSAYRNASLELLGFLGSAADELADHQSANQSVPDKIKLMKYITSLLK